MERASTSLEGRVPFGKTLHTDGDNDNDDDVSLQYNCDGGIWFAVHSESKPKSFEFLCTRWQYFIKQIYLKTIIHFSYLEALEDTGQQLKMNLFLACI